MAGLDTLYNVKFVWTIDDLMDSHEALDEKEEAEQQMMEEARNK